MTENCSLLFAYMKYFDSRVARICSCAVVKVLFPKLPAAASYFLAH
jgi:hypothetical protein